VTAAGPFETEKQARDLPAVRAIFEAFRADPGVGRMAPYTLRMLDGGGAPAAGAVRFMRCDACAAVVAAVAAVRRYGGDRGHAGAGGAGSGVPGIAAASGVPENTVRGRLRRFRSSAGRVRGFFTRLAGVL
jgi:hypothetical protein